MLNFDDMTKAQLLEYAKSRDMAGVSSADKKADILRMVKGEI